MAPIKPPVEKPQPALASIGFHGGINEFNDRVQKAHDTFVQIHGYEPTPGLVLDIARSPVMPEQFSPLLQPTSQTLARNQAAIAAHYTPLPTAKSVAADIMAAAAKGDYHTYVQQNADTIHQLSYQNKNDAATITGAIFKARRLQTFRDIETKVNNGELSPLDAHDQLQQMGYIPGGSAFKAAKGVGGVIATGIGQIADSLVHSPAGLYALGKAAGYDTADIVAHPTASDHFSHTAPIAKAMATGVQQDVEHPGRNPGYLFLDILGFASPITEAGARVAEAGRLVRAGESAGTAGRALVTRSPLRRAVVTHGSYSEEMPLSQNPLVAAAQKYILDRRQAGSDAALAGERTLPGGLRSLLLPGIAQDFFDNELSVAKKVGREADAHKQVDHVVQMTLARELDHVAGRAEAQSRMMSRVPSNLRAGLSRGEQKAIQVQSWDDPNPLQAERDFHRRMIEMEVGDPKAHQRQLADLKLAEAALKNPSPRLQKALAMTQQVVAEMQRQKIEDLGLLPETAEGRIAKAGQVLRQEPIDVHRPRENPESFYLPTQPRGKVKRPPSDRPGYFPAKAGPFGVPLPRDLPELTHEFTGKALLAGDYRIDATSLATEAYARTVRAVTVRSEHAKLWKAATDTPRTHWDVPIRDSQAIPDKLRDVVAKIDEGAFTDKEAALLPQDMRTLIEELYPNPDKLTQEDIPNVRWIDRRLLGQGTSMPHVPGLGAKVAQTVQSPFRFAALYLRPAYILNKLGNHAMLMFDQGWMYPHNFVRAMAGEKLYGEENMRTIRELVGAGKSRSYVTSSSGKISGAVAEFWNRVADRDERVAAFVYYMHRKGYHTQEDVTRLLNDKAARPDLVEVKRRANKSLVEFDNLLPVEKDYIRHWIFVYPWVSRSAVYSLRAILEHPTKAAVLSQLGRQELETDPIWKAAPAWFKRIGYVPIGWNHDGTPKVVNPTSVNTFSTLGDFVAMTRGATVGDKYATAEDFLGPLPTYFIHAASGRDQFGNQYPGSQWWDAAKEVLAGLPQLSAWDKAHPKQKKAGPSFDIASRRSLEASLNGNLKKTVLSPGWLDGYGTLIGGGLTPRNVNLSALAARYWADQDPKVRHQRELDLLNRALTIQGEALGTPVPSAVKAAVSDQANLDYQYKLFLKQTGRAPTDKERALFTVDYLKKQGLIEPGAATQAKANIGASADKTEINRIKNTLLDKYANGKALRQWDSDVSTLAKFTPAVFNEKVGRLFSQGLAPQKRFAVSQDRLYGYARKYIAFAHEAERLRKAGASPLELKAFQDAHDQPVDGLPSFVRMAWADQSPQDQQKHINSVVTQSWNTLSAFDKSLLGVQTDAKVTAGWNKLDSLVKEQRAALAREGRSFPSGYARTLAQYVQKYFDAPGLVKDFDFAKKPLYERLKYLRPIQQSPNKGLWSQLLSVAGGYSKYLHATDDTGKRHLYSSSQVRQMWRDYLSSDGFTGWLNDHPDFKTELQGYGKGTLAGLIG